MANVLSAGREKINYICKSSDCSIRKKIVLPLPISEIS